MKDKKTEAVRANEKINQFFNDDEEKTANIDPLLNNNNVSPFIKKSDEKNDE